MKTRCLSRNRVARFAPGLKAMPISIEATIETDGQVHLAEPIHLPHACQAIVTILDESDSPDIALLSESSLSEDWNRPSEEEAWSHLQQAK
ncbi:MAG: hypothetical protein ACI8QI_000237 [Limisphaerales bacterium]|jgi:hypothetical protein